VVGAPCLHFYASSGTLERAAGLLARDCAPAGFLDAATGERLNLAIHRIEPLQSFEAGRYAVTALPANHDPSVDSLIFAVRAEDRCLLYATDTAALPEEAWRGFHDGKLRFDTVILDHTYGPGHTGDDHLSAAVFVEHMDRLREERLLKEGSRAFATHISHDANPPHPELSAFSKQHGYEIAYDGLTI
jgi:phosphoribosyl 1,2-cyclic phosphate phosphodiesterase